MRSRQDGLINAMTGLGDSEIDLRLHTTREPSWQRTTAEYSTEWRENPLANREVSQAAGDMFREGFDITGLPEGIDLAAIKSWIEGDTTPNPDGSLNRTKGLLYYARKVIEQGDKVGGAALYIIVDDGLDPVHPLDWRRIQRIVGWEVLDRSEITPWVTDGMGTEPEYWMLSNVMSRPRDGGRIAALRPGQVIHASRLWRHKGVELDGREERLRQWWGASVLDLNWDPRRAVEGGTNYANTYLHRASWLHYSLSDLDGLLRETEEETGRDIGFELLDERMRQVRKIASTMGILVSDGGKPATKAADGQTEIGGRNADKVESVVERTGDLVSIVQLNRDQWQAGSSMPPSIAFGMRGSSALDGGENAGDWQSWQGTINLKRADKDVKGLVIWMLTYTFASREGPTNGLIPTKWEIHWRPLIVPSAKEKAEIALAQAQADNARIETDVAKPEEVREQRLVQGDVEGPLKAKADEVVVSTQPTNAETTAASDVQAQALNGAQMNALRDTIAAVTLGQMPVESAEWLISVAVPGLDLAKAREALEKAAAFTPVPLDGSPAVRAASVPDPTPALAMGAEPTVDADLPGDEDLRMAEVEPEPDPIDALLAEIPADLMTPAAIVEHIKTTLGLDVSTQQVHALAKKYGARSGRVGGARGFSFRDVKVAIAKDNGLELPVEPDAESVVEP
jgi:hypothetical protein